MLHTQGWRNYTLFILLLTILSYSVMEVIFYTFFVLEREQGPYALIGTLANAMEGQIHWIITQSYLKVAYETSQMLDVGVLFNDPEKLAAVHRFKRIMKAANVVIPLLILACEVCVYTAYFDDSIALYDFGAWGWLTLMAIFTCTWGWTLYKLYRDTRHSKKLLPDKRIFIFHGLLLVFFILCYALSIYSYPRAINSTTDKASNDWWGMQDLSIFLVNLVEVLIFFLVLRLMLPIGANQKMKCKEFQRFLFVGFLDRSELEAAILEKYPNLTATQISFIRSDID